MFARATTVLVTNNTLLFSVSQLSFIAANCLACMLASKSSVELIIGLLSEQWAVQSDAPA